MTDAEKLEIAIAHLQMIARGKPVNFKSLPRETARELARSALIQLGSDWSKAAERRETLKLARP
jgi:hypothetical protein